MINRYTLSPMKELWTLKAQYERWLEVELASLTAMEKLGEVPTGTLAAVKKTVRIDLPRIQEIEGEIQHDLLAFIRSLEEQAGDAGRYIHRGLTSSDVKDTALALQMRDGLNIILEVAYRLQEALLKKARQYQDLVMVGRTHGMHAEPTTLGLKLFLWHEEVARDIQRLERALKTISVGKISGPVGTYSQVSPEVERLTCENLGLQPVRVSSQIIQRDRHAEVIAAIAITGATLEKMALEIRNLSRSEVGEVEEPAPEGSSSMPHKRNPITSERICGLARLLRGNLQAALENVALWHERDMSHSCAERVIIPDSFLLAHYMLVKMTTIIDRLVVHKEQIQKNLDLTKGAIYSQILLIELVEHGMVRSKVHEVLKAASKRALDTNTSLLSVLNDDPQVAELLKEQKIDEDALFERLRATSHRIIGHE